MHAKKKTALSFLMLFLLSFSFYFIPQVHAEPEALLKESMFDAGNVKGGTRICHDFMVSNPGDKTLEISKVSYG